MSRWAVTTASHDNTNNMSPSRCKPAHLAFVDEHLVKQSEVSCQSVSQTGRQFIQGSGQFRHVFGGPEQIPSSFDALHPASTPTDSIGNPQSRHLGSVLDLALTRRPPPAPSCAPDFTKKGKAVRAHVPRCPRPVVESQDCQDSGREAPIYAVRKWRHEEGEKTPPLSQSGMV